MRGFALIENYYGGFRSQSFNQSSLKGAVELCEIRLQSYPNAFTLPLHSDPCALLPSFHHSKLSCRAAVVCLIAWSRKWKGEDRSKAVSSRHGFSLPVEPIAVTSYEQLNEVTLRELRGAMQRL